MKKKRTSIEILKDRAKKLLALLEDPHPSIATWNADLMESIHAIAAFGEPAGLREILERWKADPTG